MSKILDLLKNENVEWKKLSEVCEFINGYAFKSNLFRDEGIPIVRITNIDKGKIIFNDLKYINESDYSNLQSYIVNYGDILIAMSGATTGKIGYNENKTKSYLNQRVGKFKPNEKILNNKYLFHFLCGKEEYIHNLANGAGAQPNLSKLEILNIEIPIPSLKAQEEIVKILDQFSHDVFELQKHLKLELEARIKQYEYYRDLLLSEDYLNKLIKKSFPNNEEFKLKEFFLGEMCECYDGTHQTPKYTESGVPFVSVENIKNIYGTKKFISIEAFNNYKVKPQKDDLFMTRIGDIGTCALVKNNDSLAYYVTLALLRPNQNIILTKFLKFLIESNQGKKELDRRILHKAHPIKINLGEIPRLKFLIPPLEVQQKVVETLDPFNKIVNDLQQGLPKEIELRQKQYEHYREKLLNFKKES